MNNTGVALVDGIATAGHGVAHPSPLQRTFTADYIILTAASAHNTPFWTGAVVVQVPVILKKTHTQYNNIITTNCNT